MLAFFKGLQYTTPINGAVIMITVPTIVLNLSAILLKEPIKKISNELENIPKSEVREPINPDRLPNSNPNLLFVDCIKFESIGELIIEPIIIKDIGRVA